LTKKYNLSRNRWQKTIPKKATNRSQQKLPQKTLPSQKFPKTLKIFIVHFVAAKIDSTTGNEPPCLQLKARHSKRFMIWAEEQDVEYEFKEAPICPH
jgi:hypothetical protein